MTIPPRLAPHGGPALLMLVVFAVAASYAISVDVPRTGYGVKSDEATYVATALSAAYDGNLSFERRDLERFESLYQSGPEGIFLKRGKQLRIHPSLVFPFVRTVKASRSGCQSTVFRQGADLSVVRRAIRPHPGPERPAAVQRACFSQPLESWVISFWLRDRRRLRHF